MPKQIKTLMLPLAMAAGLIFSPFFAGLNFLTTYLIFVMLFITFCGITPKEMNFSPMHWLLLGFQIAVGCGAYFAVRGLDPVLAQGIMICILTPTAVSAVVVAGMLGANVATMTTFSIMSNISVAIVAPLIFPLAGAQAGLPFAESFLTILRKVVPILVVPFAAAFVLRAVAPRIHTAIGRVQSLSFYLWSLALMIVTGRTVEFIRAQDASHYKIEIALAAAALVVCIVQFALGRKIGRRYGDAVAGGQSLGQKNTILAIWMSQTYLDPIASIAPASYVIWQNIVNSWQLWRKHRR